MINFIKCHFCIKKAHVYRCVLIIVKIYCLVECKYGHFCPMCVLETKLAVCSPQVPGESRQQDLFKYHGESCGNCNWPVIVIICWICRFAFSSRMITTCIRVFGSLPVCIEPERNIDIMVSSHSDANSSTSDGIPSLSTAFLFLSLLTISHSSCTLITSNIIMAWDSPQCIQDLISVVSGASRICYYTEIIFP